MQEGFAPGFEGFAGAEDARACELCLGGVVGCFGVFKVYFAVVVKGSVLVCGWTTGFATGAGSEGNGTVEGDNKCFSNGSVLFGVVEELEDEGCDCGVGVCGIGVEKGEGTLGGWCVVDEEVGCSGIVMFVI